MGLLLAVPTVLFAQEVQIEIAKKIITVGNKQFYMHHVKKGETLYALSKAYHVDQEEIVRLNPELADGLKADMVIGIPYVKIEEPQTGEPDTDTPYVEEPKEEAPQVEEPKEEEPQGTQPFQLHIEGADDGEGYRVYEVKKTERTKKLLRTLNVEIEEFRMMNPSVGSMVFAGQRILIPAENASEAGTVAQNPVTPEPSGNDEHPTGHDGQQPSDNPSVMVVPISIHEEDNPQSPDDQPSDEPVANEEIPFDALLFAEDDQPDECFASYRNADRTYRVALLTPLYLNEIDKLDTSKDRIEKTKKSRALKFLQFYEGFMMAVDSLTQNHGLRLDLTVIDVTENTAGAQEAVKKLRDNPVDIIIGPFFSKSFAIVQEYAAESSTMIVNPMSERESILSDAPFVVKLKPNPMAMISELKRLLQTQYPKAKVSLLVDGSSAKADSVLVNTLEATLATSVPPEVELTNAELLDIIAKESRRRKMGKKTLSTLEMEGKILSTKSLKEHPDGITYFENHFQRYSFKDSEINAFKESLSSGRDNILIAYGDDIVFATKVLNTINKSAQKYPITLIGLPSWEEFDNLLVENLLNMNAIYFEDHFVDYNDSAVMKFVDDFRLRYESEPMDYAFEGFDVGWYFLNALMQFGSHPMDCLPYYHLPLMHSRYYFNKTRHSNGLENRYWSIYQFDNQAIELKPIITRNED